MSNNKSRHLSRKAGGYKVYGPSSGSSETVDELNDRIQLIQFIVEKLNPGLHQRDEEVIKEFTTIVGEIKTNPDKIAQIVLKTGSKKEVVDRLFHMYTSLSEPEDIEFMLSLLFRDKRW